AARAQRGGNLCRKARSVDRTRWRSLSTAHHAPREIDFAEVGGLGERRGVSPPRRRVRDSVGNARRAYAAPFAFRRVVTTRVWPPMSLRVGPTSNSARSASRLRTASSCV